MKSTNCSNKSKLVWKKLKPTPAEIDLKRKYDQAKTTQDTTKSMSRVKKLKQKQSSTLNNTLPEALSPRAGDSNERHSDLTGGSGNPLHLAQQQLPSIDIASSCLSLRGAGRIALGSNDEQKLAQSNSSKVLGERPIPPRRIISSKTSSHNISKQNSKLNESMTSQIFNQDHMSQNGSMALKPLRMETVMEQDERRFSPRAMMPSPLDLPKDSSTMKLLSDAVIYEKKKGMMNYKTTEQNIAMQQQLDFASAEDLISFRSKPDITIIGEDSIHEHHQYATLVPPKNLCNTQKPLKQQITEGKQTAVSPNIKKMNMKSKSRSNAPLSSQQPQFKILPSHSVTLTKEQLISLKRNPQGISKQNTIKFADSTRNRNNVAALDKRLFDSQMGGRLGGATSEYYQSSLHPGLQKLHQNNSQTKENNHPVARASKMSLRTDFTQALNSMGSYHGQNEPQTGKFDESAIESGRSETYNKSLNLHLLKDFEKDIFKQPTALTQEELQQQLLGEDCSKTSQVTTKLFKQPTFSSKTFSRQYVGQQNSNPLTNQDAGPFNNPPLSLAFDTDESGVLSVEKKAGQNSKKEIKKKADTVTLANSKQTQQASSKHRRMKSESAFGDNKSEVAFPLQNLRDGVTTACEKTPENCSLQQPENQESQLVTDFNMHRKNQERLMNLMTLLGKEDDNERPDEIDTGNFLDAASISSLPKPTPKMMRNKSNKQIKKNILPRIINQRAQTMTIQEGRAEDLASSSSLEADSKYRKKFDAQTKQKSELYASSAPDSVNTSVESLEKGEEQQLYSDQYNQLGTCSNFQHQDSSKDMINVRVEDQTESKSGTKNSKNNCSGLFRQILNGQQGQNSKEFLNTVGRGGLRNSQSTLFANENRLIQVSVSQTSPHLLEKTASALPHSIKDQLSKNQDLLHNTYRSVGQNRYTTKELPSKFHAKSLSQHRLEPLAINSSRVIETTGSTYGAAQSSLQYMRNQQILHLKKPLQSYVLVKGKAQNSQKYIQTDLQPYTTIASTQQKCDRGGGPQGRRPLMLQHVQGSQPLSIAQQKMQLGKAAIASGKKPKRVGKVIRKRILGKSKVNDNRTNGASREASVELGAGDLLSQSLERVNVSWQEMQEENDQLKEQILNQIAIFEQYLKVAVLQHNSIKMQEQKRLNQAMQEPESLTKKAKKQIHARKIMRTSSAGSNFVLSRERDFEFETNQANEYSSQHNIKERGKTSSVQSRKEFQISCVSCSKGQGNAQPTMSKMRKVKMQRWSSGIQRPTANHGEDEYCAVSNRMHKEQKCTSQYDAQSTEYMPGSQNQSMMSGYRSMVSKNDKLSIYRSAKALNFAKQKCQDKRSAAKEKYEQTSKRSNSITKSSAAAAKHNKQMRALGYLLPSKDYSYSHWMAKIQKLWGKLNKYKNDEVIQIQNQINMNRKHCKKLTLDNLFELDVNANEQKVLTRVRGQKATVNKILKQNQEAKKVQQLQQRVRQELNRKFEFNTWGFHNYIISYRIKVRMTEDIIDCAQRLLVKSDEKTERELGILKLLRDRTYEDLNTFVQKREKQPWRVWDGRHVYGYGHDFKPSLEALELSYFEIGQKIDKNLHALSILEKVYTKLRADIPTYNTINTIMVQFCSYAFGNEGWLQLFQMRQLRRQQEQEQHDKQYMPPVEQIKNLEVDPYTLQVEEEKDNTNEPNYETNQIQESKEPDMKVTGWERCKPASLPIYQEQTTAKKKTNQKDSPAAPASGQMAEKLIQEPAEIYENANTAMVKSNAAEAELEEDKMQNEHNEYQKQKSSWLETLAKEKEEKSRREDMERKARAARLAILFDSEAVPEYGMDDEDENDDFDDEMVLDFGAAKGDVANYMEKIDTHLQVEKRILEAWQQNDIQTESQEAETAAQAQAQKLLEASKAQEAKQRRNVLKRTSQLLKQDKL